MQSNGICISVVFWSCLVTQIVKMISANSKACPVKSSSTWLIGVMLMTAPVSCVSLTSSPCRVHGGCVSPCVPPQLWMDRYNWTVSEPQGPEGRQTTLPVHSLPARPRRPPSPWEMTRLLWDYPLLQLKSSLVLL